MFMMMQSSQGGDVVSVIVFAVIMIVGGFFSLALYLLPTILSIFRDHPQKGPIIAINLLVGWTFIGWVVAIVWSVSNIQRPPANPSSPQYNYRRI